MKIKISNEALSIVFYSLSGVLAAVSKVFFSVYVQLIWYSGAFVRA